jgi:hypothetical protein
MERHNTYVIMHDVDSVYYDKHTTRIVYESVIDHSNGRQYACRLCVRAGIVVNHDKCRTKHHCHDVTILCDFMLEVCAEWVRLIDTLSTV